jgi:hypothetical protein
VRRGVFRGYKHAKTPGRKDVKTTGWIFGNSFFYFQGPLTKSHSQRGRENKGLNFRESLPLFPDASNEKSFSKKKRTLKKL